MLFTGIARPSNTLYLVEFASRKKGNCNRIPYLDTLLNTRLYLNSSHMTHIQSDDVYTKS